MRKQYRYYEGFDKYYLYVYHDGELIETKKVWLDEITDEIDKLESDGYTFGYTKEAVEDTRRQYEHMLANMIGQKMSKLIRISESDDFVVDYDKERGMYRISVFDDGHFWDEYWFDAYEEREVDN